MLALIAAITVLVEMAATGLTCIKWLGTQIVQEVRQVAEKQSFSTSC